MIALVALISILIACALQEAGYEWWSLPFFLLTLFLAANFDERRRR